MKNDIISIKILKNICEVSVSSSKKEDNGKWTFEVSSAKDTEEVEGENGTVHHNRSVSVRSKVFIGVFAQTIKNSRFLYVLASRCGYLINLCS